VTLNVAGPDTRRLKDIAEAIGRAVGHEPRFELRDAPAPQLVGPTETLRRTLGWSPRIGLDDGLRRWLARS
jgi:nucleoside-diphosphate-sugar epimerase